MANNGVVLGLVALVFATWSVYLGGLSSQQHLLCKGKLNSTQPCKEVYRFEWWIFSYEFFIFATLAAVTAAGMLNKFKLSFVGLFAIATVFYSMRANVHFDVLDASFDGTHGQPLGSQRTMIAGLVMTAVVNFFITIAVGVEDAAS